MKAVRALLMVAILMAGLASSALAQEIVVMNGTDFTIKALGLVDSNADGDAEDLLGEDTLAPGEGLKINIDGDPNGWELIAVDEEDGQVNWQNLNLKGVKKITLLSDGTANLE